MITIIATYKLKKGVNMEDFIEFIKTKDIPLLNSFKEIDDFTVHLVEGPNKDVDIFEVVKADSWKSWEKLSDKAEMKKHAQLWSTFGDGDTVKIYYGKKIE